MSLLSSFIQNQLLKAIESEFSAHAPEMQAVILNEMNLFANQSLAWVESKLHITPQAKE